MGGEGSISQFSLSEDDFKSCASSPSVFAENRGSTPKGGGGQNHKGILRNKLNKTRGCVKKLDTASCLFMLRDIFLFVGNDVT